MQCGVCCVQWQLKTESSNCDDAHGEGGRTLEFFTEENITAEWSTMLLLSLIQILVDILNPFRHHSLGFRVFLAIATGAEKLLTTIYFPTVVQFFNIVIAFTHDNTPWLPELYIHN